MQNIRKELNKYTISFLILTITLFGIFSFFINKDTIDSILNYYTIFASGIGVLILFFNNLEEFKPKKIRKFTFSLIIITCLWIIITAFLGIRFNIEAIKGFINIACLLALGFVILNIKLSDDDKKFIMKNIYISFAICMIIGIIQYFTGINLIQYSNDVYPGILGRINSTFYIATLLDKYIVVISILLIYNLVKSPEKASYKLLYLLGTTGICLTFSRSGLLIFVFLTFLLFVISLFKKQISNMFLVLLTAITVMVIPGTSLSLQSGLDFVYDTLSLPNVMRIDITKINYLFVKDNNKSFAGGFDSEGSESSGETEGSDPVERPINFSNEVRDTFKNIGKQLIKDYPIFGIGIGNYSYLYNNQNFADYMSDTKSIDSLTYYAYPHSGYVQTASEIGIIGLVLIIVTIASFGIYVDKKDGLLVFTFIALIGALLFAAYTETVFNSKQYIFLFMLFLSCICSKKLEVEELALDKKKKSSKSKKEK